MNRTNSSTLEYAQYLLAQARLDARTDHRTGGGLMYSIYANLRRIGNLSAEDWRRYQEAYQHEQRRLTGEGCTPA